MRRNWRVTMKKTINTSRDIIDLGCAMTETKGPTGDIADEVLKRPFGGLGIQ
jgi:hypothetical protein